MTTAKLFKSGRSQAVRLPREFRFKGKEVRIRRYGMGVLLEPVKPDMKEWRRILDSYKHIPFMEDGRDQPMAEERKLFD
ncbi:MAG: antitoxin [Rhodospirillales bacterium]